MPLTDAEKNELLQLLEAKEAAKVAPPSTGDTARSLLGTQPNVPATTQVDPAINDPKTAYNTLGLIPKGTTENLLKSAAVPGNPLFGQQVFSPMETFAKPQQPNTLVEGMGMGEKAGVMARNAFRTLGGLAAQVPQFLEDPVTTGEEAATYIPKYIRDVAQAAGMGAAGDPERRFEATQRVTENPAEGALLALPLLMKGMGLAETQAAESALNRRAGVVRRLYEQPETKAATYAETMKDPAGRSILRSLEREVPGNEKPAQSNFQGFETDNLTELNRRIGRSAPEPTKPRVAQEPTAPQVKPVVQPDAGSTPAPSTKQPVMTVQEAPKPAPVKPVTKAGQSADAGVTPPKPPKEPPKATIPPADKQTVGPGNKKIAEQRAEIPGLKDLDEPTRKRWVESDKEAVEAGIPDRALQIADEVLGVGKEKGNPRPLTAAETAGVTRKRAELKNEINRLFEDSKRLDKEGKPGAAIDAAAKRRLLEEQVDRLTEAQRLANVEAGRAVSILNSAMDVETFDIASVTQRARETAGRKLTKVEEARLTEAANKYQEVESRYNELLSKYQDSEAKRQELEAQRFTETQARVAKAREESQVAKKKIMAERQDIKKQLAAIGYRVNDITGITAEGAYLVGRLAVNYMKEGAATLSDVVKAVQADIPELSAQDIYRAINSKNPRAQAKARSTTQKQVARLKTQARLLDQLEKAKNGIFEPTRKRPVTSPEIASLQKQLRDLRSEAYRSGMDGRKLEIAVDKLNRLQDQLANKKREIRQSKTKTIAVKELADIQDQIKQVQKSMRVEDKLADLNEQLRTGDFKLPEKQPQPKLPSELVRAEVELRMARRKVRNEIRELEPWTKGKIVTEATNLLREAKATADMSAAFRQAFPLIAMRPVKFTKAFGKSFKAAFSEVGAEKIMANIERAPQHYVRQDAGLYISELGGRLKRGEEFFASRLLDRIPIIKDITRGSERHMITMLNQMRVAAFDDFYFKFPNATRAELSAWADFVNKASGRGNIQNFGLAGQAWGQIFFAPRFAASRFQAPYALKTHWRLPRVRKAIAQELTATVSMGMATLGLAKLAGAEVGTDPREPEFGKIVVGDTKIDIWGGFQQPARLILRAAVSGADRSGLSEKLGLDSPNLSPFEKEFDPVEGLGRFAAFKLGPGVQLARYAFTGKNAIGEDMTLTDAAAEQFMPLVWRDISETWKQEGLGRAAWTGPLNFVGVGTNTYPKSIAQTRREITRLMTEGRMFEAFKSFEEWNYKNPDKQISPNWYRDKERTGGVYVPSE